MGKVVVAGSFIYDIAAYVPHAPVAGESEDKALLLTSHIKRLLKLAIVQISLNIISLK